MTKELPSGVAIISMAGRFPGAQDIDGFWELLRDGREGISFFSAEELIEAGISPKLVNNPNYVRARGMLPDIERFDARFFGYSPREAEILDPQQRIFLETCWEAMELGGYAREGLDRSVGVFAGCIGGNTYLTQNLLGNHALRESVGDYPIFIANDKDSLTTRVAYKLNLRGPAITVQTMCSTSLVAVATACQNLMNFQCDMALAGGVAITVPQKNGYLYLPGLVVSPDGHCRAFDAKAKGTLTSSGIGVVLLKRIEDAIEDGDPIVAVIRGWSVNNDGADKVGYNAPSVQGQADCITQALAMADVSPETIGFVEAHGTGTPVGDPIEVAALSQAFQVSTKRRGYCALGSVKTNVGHLETAAGVAGLIKAALAVQHGQIPPTLHFETPNPEIDLPASPFYVNTKLLPWPQPLSPRRAGVSSLGVGGTNAHLVLEEAPPLLPTDPGQTWKLLVLSARSAAALDTATANLARHLKEHPALELADVAYTLQLGRRTFSHRRLIVCSDVADAVAGLGSRDASRLLTGEAPGRPPGVVFLFSGQGSQYVNMGRDLYQREPTFRAQVDLCCEQLKPHLGFDLRTILFPKESERERAVQQLGQTAITQPALFVLEYALAQLWMSLGLEPVAMIGHSLGEYVAACLAGVMSLRDALSLVVQRGALMQKMQPGAMLAVPLTEEQVRPLLSSDLSLAAINGPSHCVVAGPIPSIEALDQRLAAQGLRGRRLHTSHAFHSAMMEPMLQAFTERVRRVQLSPPKIRYISNVSGRWIAPQEATDPSYYARQIRGTVRFSPGLELILSEPDRVLLEIGPGAALSILARQHPDPIARRVIVSSLRGVDGATQELQTFLSALGRLWLTGCPVRFDGLYSHERRRRVPLPTYPFERERFWIEPVAQAAEVRPTPAPAKRPKTSDVEGYFYRPSWRALPAPVAVQPRGQQICLLFVNEHPLCARLARRLRQQGHAVTTVRAGAGFGHELLDEYTVGAGSLDDYDLLLRELIQRGRSPGMILHLWNVGERPERESSDGAPLLDGLHEAQDLAYFSLVHLARALGRHVQSEAVRLVVVTSGAVRVQPEEALSRPERALVTGPCRVIPSEYRNVTCVHADVQPPVPGGADEEVLTDRLLGEAFGESPEPVVAYRDLQRYALAYRPAQLPRPEGEIPRLRHGGAYLITGGLGGIGMVLAEYLARSYNAKLILLSREGLPDPQEVRAAALAKDERAVQLGRRIQKVEALERLGSQVMVVRADISDHAAVKAAVEAAVARFGPIRGIIHAAGVPGGGVIQRRSREASESVLSPKVKGTLVLDALFQQRDLDFFLLCSSLNSVLGGFGQADYAAANAFQDAYASYRSHHSRGLTVAVNWDAWREVGMAADAARQRGAVEPSAAAPQAVTASQYREIAHPLFERFMRDAHESDIYVTRLGVPRSWVLSEHRVNGRPTLPGTAYLELARAAYEMHLADVRPIELRDVAFLSPLTVDEGHEREVRTVLRRTGQGEECEFTIVSRPDPARDYWQEHARGRLAPLPTTPPTRHDVERFLSNTPLVFNEHQIANRPRPIEFGPRWQNLGQVRFGRNQGLALIRLPDAFEGDLDTFMLHPALLDSASGFVAVQNPGHYLPFAYRRVRILRPLPRSLYSYAAFEQVLVGGRQRLHLNLTVMDTSGVVVLEMEDYVLVKVTT